MRIFKFIVFVVLNFYLFMFLFFVTIVHDVVWIGECVHTCMCLCVCMYMCVCVHIHASVCACAYE